MFFYNAAMEQENDMMSAEVVANGIISTAGVEYDNVPIDVEKILKGYDFSIGKVAEFGLNDMIAGIAHAERKQPQLGNNKFFIFKEDIPLRDRRYLMSLAIVSYVLKSQGDYYSKTFESNVLVDFSKPESQCAGIARAVLMPQKSLSTLLMSPMLYNLSHQEKIDRVAKAFLVSNGVARTRMIETGLI